MCTRALRPPLQICPGRPLKSSSPLWGRGLLPRKETAEASQRRKTAPCSVHACSQMQQCHLQRSNRDMALTSKFPSLSIVHVCEAGQASERYVSRVVAQNMILFENLLGTARYLSASIQVVKCEVARECAMTPFHLAHLLILPDYLHLLMT